MTRSFVGDESPPLHRLRTTVLTFAAIILFAALFGIAVGRLLTLGIGLVLGTFDSP